jgi:putative ABC transport system permease protein
MISWDIRLATLGARSADGLRLVLSRGLSLTIAGAALGIGAALWLTRVLRTLLFGISPTDPVSFVSVAVVLVLVALLACWIPARAATRVQPASALRVE